jgi:type II secretory pathway pseudopilin PulG
MNGAQEILVVILASTLAVFLVLAIAATVLFIRILRIIKRLAEKAEHLTDAAETVTQNVRQAVSSLSILRWIEKFSQVIHATNSGKSNRNAKGGE